jgi:hypothetical protein
MQGKYAAARLCHAHVESKKKKQAFYAVSTPRITNSS